MPFLSCSCSRVDHVCVFLFSWFEQIKWWWWWWWWWRWWSGRDLHRMCCCCRRGSEICLDTCTERRLASADTVESSRDFHTGSLLDTAATLTLQHAQSSASSSSQTFFKRPNSKNYCKDHCSWVGDNMTGKGNVIKVKQFRSSGGTSMSSACSWTPTATRPT